MLHPTALTLATVSIALSSGCASLVRPRVVPYAPPATSAHRGLDRFTQDDFGLLDLRNRSTGTLPWKLAATALVLSEAPKLGRPADQSALSAVLLRFGLLTPGSIANWPEDAGPAPRAGDTIGQVRGMGRSELAGLELELRSPSCSLCHAGVLYDAAGRPTDSVWLGLPNTWLHLDELNRILPAAVRAALAGRSRLVSAMRSVFPGISERELGTYERFVIPRALSQLDRTSPGPEPLVPFDNGGAGTVNNLAARLIAAGETADAGFRDRQTAIVSPPILTNRAFRSSLMWDGNYAAPGAERFEPVTRREAEARGSARHAGLITVFSIGEGGAHPSRAGRRVQSFREVAPILDGLWATAPYLHNGSVPTLWHLMHPNERPMTFEVGGHRLDYGRMGIALEPLEPEAGAEEECGAHLRFPASWKAPSQSSIYNTRLQGRSNSGHASPFDRMSENDKRAVLEFLKLL